MSKKEIEETITRLKSLPNVKKVIQELVEEKFKESKFRDDKGNFTLKNCGEETLGEIVDYLINLSALAIGQLLS